MRFVMYYHKLLVVPFMKGSEGGFKKFNKNKCSRDQVKFLWIAHQKVAGGNFMYFF